MRLAILVLLLGCGPRARDASPPVANQAPSAETTVGTAAPIHLIEMSNDGRWIAICQARRDTDGKPGLLVDDEDPDDPKHARVIGDAYRPYLVWGSGAGEPFDAFLNASRDRRWLAVANLNGTERVAQIIDSHTRARFELAGARVIDDRSNNLRRTIAIGTDHVAYTRGKDIVIRELRADRERVIPIPYGVIWQVEIDNGGRWAKVGVVETDTDGDGTLEGPYGTTMPSHRTWRCLPGVTPIRFRDDGDRLVPTWIDMVTGKAIHDRAAIAPVGDRMLYTGDDDALVLGGRTLAKKCRWGITAISHDPPRVITGCGFGRDTIAEDVVLQVFGGDKPRLTRLPFEAAFGAHRIMPSERDPKVVTGWLCSNHRCLEVATGREVEVPGRVVYQFAQYATYMVRPRGKDHWEGASWFVIDLATGDERQIPDTRYKDVGLHELPILEVRDSIGDIPTTLYDMRTGPVGLDAGVRILGHDFVRHRYLVGPDEAWIGFPDGPFRWVDAAR